LNAFGISDEEHNKSFLKKSSYHDLQTAERFAEITKTAIITGKYFQSKKCLAPLNDYWQQEATKQNCYFQCLIFSVSLYGNAPLHYFRSFPKILKGNTSANKCREYNKCNRLKFDRLSKTLIIQ
jgi:hypothetical protein